MKKHALTFLSVLSALIGGSFLHPVVTGQAGQHVGGTVVGSTVQGGVVTGQGLVPAAAAFVGLALLFGLFRLGLDGYGPVPIVLEAAPRPSRTTARKTAATAAAVLVVSTAALSGVGGPLGATSTASAEWSDSCSFTDSLLGAAYNTLIGADTGCRWVAGDQTDVENLTATDAYANGLGLKDSADSYVTSTGNLLENSQTVAYSKAKIELVNGVNNGTSVSQAKNTVNNTVDDFASRQARDIIADWNQKVTQIQYLNNTSATVKINFWSSPNWAENNVRFLTYKATLPNGTMVDVKAMAGGSQYVVTPLATNSTLQVDDTDGTTYDADYRPGYVTIDDPDDGSPTEILHSNDYGNVGSYGINNETAHRMLLDDVYAYPSQVKDNMAPYVDEVYNQYQAGEINSTDLALNDPSVIAQEASTSLNSTGYYGHAAIMLASIGASGNINVSHSINVTDANGTVTSLDGTLYYTADDVPAGGWATNQTYNMSNFNGTFYMAVAKETGDATVVDLENYGTNFTIVEATNTQTGESVNATEVHTYTYDSTNASALANEIDRLRELRDEYESQLDSSGSAGWDLGGASTGAIVALFAVVGLLLATRD